MQQALIPGVDTSALKPGAGQFNMLQQASLVERLPCGRQSECSHVPGHQFGAGCETHVQPVLCHAIAVTDGIEWQPLQPRSRGQPNPRVLLPRFALRPVETGRTGRGEQRMGAVATADRDLQRVTADDAARRVQQHVVADRLALGIEAVQDPKRAIVPMAYDDA